MEATKLDDGIIAVADTLEDDIRHLREAIVNKDFIQAIRDWHKQVGTDLAVLLQLCEARSARREWP